MKRTLTLLVLCIVPIASSAEVPKEQMKGIADMIKKELKLAPFIQRIQKGTISPKHTSILAAILKNTTEVRIHQQNGAKENTVYLGPDGHKEAVYDKDGKLVTDGVNDGSYNYFHPSKEPLYHFSFDICPWILWGQSPTDSTTVKSRIHAYMGDLEGGIRRTLKQQKRPKGNWKPDGQIQALAVFMRAIQEGKAQTLFALFEPQAKVTDKQIKDVLTKLNRGLETVYSVPTKEPKATDKSAP